jgi:hypothetical protein
MQKSSPPPLLPLLRSRLQAEILTLVLLGPEQEWSLTGLASRTGASVSSVQREITRAEQAGVVRSRRLASARLVKAAESPLTAPLTELLLLRSFGPRQVLAEELDGVEGIERPTCSARGLPVTRVRRAPPTDLDVLVIGAPDTDELDDAAQQAAGRLAREVNVTIRSPAWWREGADGFHADVTRRPLVPLFSRELISGGELGQVPPDAELARRMLADAGRHLATAAAAESTGDLPGAYQLAYDALRKSAAGTSRYRTRSLPSSGPVSGHFARSAGSGAHATASSIPARRCQALRETT